MYNRSLLRGRQKRKEQFEIVKDFLKWAIKYHHDKHFNRHTKREIIIDLYDSIEWYDNPYCWLNN